MERKRRAGTAVTLAVLAVVIVALAVRGNGQQRPSPPGINFGYMPGRIGAIPLRYFGSVQLSSAWESLLVGRGWEARPKLEQWVRDHPDDLAAFVGLLQANPDSIPGEVMRYEDAVRKGAGGPTTRFRLGTLLLYRWGLREPRTRSQFDDERARATALLENAWREHQTVLFGLMLCEAYECHRAGFYDSDKVLDTLLQKIAGQTAYQQYREAMESGWKSEPPRVALVPAENRRSLVAVLAKMWSIATARIGHFEKVNGKLRQVTETPPDWTLPKEQYLYLWKTSVQRAIGDSAHL